MTTPDITGLCERLRQTRSVWSEAKEANIKRRRNPDGPEAADLIERLAALLAASPQEAVPTKREAALAALAKLDGETMDLAASPQGEGSSADAKPAPKYELHPTGSGGSSDVLTYRVTEGVK